MIIEFEHPVPFGNGKREARFSEDDGFKFGVAVDYSWVTVEHPMHGHQRHVRIGFTVLESADEVRVEPPTPASSADSSAEEAPGQAGSQDGAAGEAGSTPARSARKRR